MAEIEGRDLTWKAFAILDKNGNGKIEDNELNAQLFNNRLKNQPEEVKREAERLRSLLLNENFQLTDNAKVIAAQDNDPNTLSYEELIGCDADDDGQIDDLEIINAVKNSSGDGSGGGSGSGDGSGGGSGDGSGGGSGSGDGSGGGSGSGGTDNNTYEEELLFQIWYHLTGGDGSLSAEDFDNFATLPDKLKNTGVFTALQNLLVSDGKLSDSFWDLAGDDGKLSLSEVLDLDTDDNGVISDGEVHAYINGEGEDGSGDGTGGSGDGTGGSGDGTGGSGSGTGGSGSGTDGSGSGTGGSGSGTGGDPAATDWSDGASDDPNAGEAPQKTVKIDRDGNIIGPDGEKFDLDDMVPGRLYTIYKDSTCQVDIVVNEKGHIIYQGVSVLSKDGNKRLLFEQDEHGNISATMWIKDENGEWVPDPENPAPNLPNKINTDKDGTGAEIFDEYLEDFGIKLKYWAWEADGWKTPFQIIFCNEHGKANGKTITLTDTSHESSHGNGIEITSPNFGYDELPKGSVGNLFAEGPQGSFNVGTGVEWTEPDGEEEE